MIDSGEHGGRWAMVMPRAVMSLRQHLKACGGTLPLDDVVSVLLDIAVALNSLDGDTVHRDLKPDNIPLAGSARMYSVVSA
ncbi:hypothetical protein EOT10_36855 [Streptomyces antnestii]|uniref:Protein kinase domain-containing protein n=1 Tax=Streptomyces antnestii TaxID=2494256 RepID=A0A437P1T7_9ACTN|nr:hypothetical protein [Streptomyces sp. San01]RVU16247.1 hypothetical protein EOT10_36855 [Streptomyces sp. San01]